MNRLRGLRLLHITPHLGGGVGRAMVSLAKGDALPRQPHVERSVLCLEPPQKTGAVQRLRALGVAVHTLSDWKDLPGWVETHDLVQFEVWNHPLLFAAWARLDGVPMRAVFWCHVSGLHFPRLPQVLWQQPFPVALSAPCSLQANDAGLRDAWRRGQAHVVSSAGGFEHWPAPRTRPAKSGVARLGYLGSLNLAKMHPRYVEWMAAGANRWSRVEVLGDEVQPGALAERCQAAGLPQLLQLKGFCPDVHQVLTQWDAMVYLLNPFHYGTAELALLEAMASGVVPIVLDSPCESDVVQHGDTGWIVRSPDDLTEVLARCRRDPFERQAMGRRAAAWVRETFTTQRQAQGWRPLYAEAMARHRTSLEWTAWIGTQPWQWFAATLPDPACFPPGLAPQVPLGDGCHAHLEATKGSVHHFARSFPGDAQLQAWSHALIEQQDARLARVA